MEYTCNDCGEVFEEADEDSATATWCPECLSDDCSATGFDEDDEVDERVALLDAGVCPECASSVSVEHSHAEFECRYCGASLHYEV